MKKTLYVFITTFLFFSFNTVVNAYSSLSTNASTVANGSSFTTTVSLSKVASWNVHVSASGPVSGCTINESDSSSNALNTSKTFTTTCKATGTGTIKITMWGDATDENDNKQSIAGTKQVTVVNKTANNSSNSSNVQNNNTNNNTDASKSSINTLKSLSVEGQNIDFNKDKTEYTLILSNEITKIKINAETSDSKATVSGTGEKDLSEGTNNFDIIVKAENGDTKTYNLKVTVDAKPIVVKIGDKEYNIVKNKEDLPELTLKHEDLTLNIEDQEVPAYRIDKLNYVLVGLKDSDGKIRLYRFDSYKDSNKPFKYTLFRQFNFEEINVSYLDFPSKLIPKNYKKYVETINGEKVTVYKLSKKSNYSLFYGINLETGKKHIYKYDNNEKTIQIYDNKELSLLEKQIENYEIYILSLIVLCSFLLLLVMVISITKRKKIRKILKHYNNKKAESKPEVIQVTKQN